MGDSRIEIQWDQTYGRSLGDSASTVLQTADGGFVLTGSIGSYEGDDMWLVKTDADGIKQWDQTYGGIGTDAARSVLQTPDGGFVLAGYTSSYGAGEADMWLVKTDAQGVPQWNQTYGGIRTDDATSILQTPDGGFVLAGSTESYGAGERDMWLVKIRSSGGFQSSNGYSHSGAPGLESLPLLATALVLSFRRKRKRKTTITDELQ